jgi:O-6-methylguanine DNA methyltransferase
MVGQKIHLGVFAFLRDIQNRRRNASRYFLEGKEIMSSFKQKVISIVSRIPRGKFLTYKEVARRAGNPKAARAVGNILNKYYFDCVRRGKKPIPCHRVVRSDGKPGGYARGEKEKRKLLQKENAI